MATPIIKFKRSAVEGKRPDINSMELGELAINTYDGRIFLRRDASGAAGVDTGNYLVNPFIENNSFTGIAYTGDVEVSGVTTATNVNISTVNLSGIGTYADDTAAGSGGLSKGDVYMTSTGELRIKL